MKKTNVAVGVIVALGVIWAGAAWFTGKQLETHMDQLVQNANTQLNAYAPNSRLKISYQDYQRGVFSSQTKLVIQATSQTEDNSLLKPGQSIVFNEKISHGPFPFAQLKHGNLIPSMASVHTELANTNAVKKLFELTNNHSLINAETRIGYSGATDTALKVLPIDYQNVQSGERAATNGGVLNVSIDSKGDSVSLDSDIGSVALTSKNEMGQPVLFTLNNLNVSGKTHLSPEGVRIGDQAIDVEKVNASINGQDALTLLKLKGTSSFDNHSGKIGGNIDYHVASVQLQQQDFGQATLKMKLSQFDAQAVKTFSDNYNAQLQDLLNQQGLADDPIRYQAGVHTILLNNLPTLLKGSPSISIAPLSWKNDKGESTFNLTANFNDPATVSGEPQSLSTMIDRILKTLDGKLIINMPMATETMRHVGLAEGYQAEDAQKLADQQVKGLAAMGQMFRLTQQQDDNIVTTLQYARGQVNMNGNKMTLEQFMSRYMLGMPTSDGMPQ
ncbi:MAG: YdgA family protein [Enterobacterales bacterium endosymbiont of Blomia tropicalis]|uniref:YdgA family protein n=1 Tax=Mixta mediterraneensis TaxID=2758443 RepID=UPI0025A8F6C5|nr:YdgA family protein [Mixta mediterraneensis]MDL4915073.1 YdgA family protein [Mixta mediterraneensis]